jgi:hypothetical protein
MATETNADWGGDGPPSLPSALTTKKHITFGGFCWTESGIRHDLSAAEVESMRIPPFAPAPAPPIRRR